MSFLSRLKGGGNNGGGGAERNGYSAPQAPRSTGLHAVESHVDPLLNAAGGYAGMRGTDGKFIVGDELRAKVQQQFGDSEQIKIVVNHTLRIRQEEEARRARQ